jgi:amino acid transporter
MVLSYSIVGALIFLLMHCITEFVTQFPVAGTLLFLFSSSVLAADAIVQVDGLRTCTVSPMSRLPSRSDGRPFSRTVSRSPVTARGNFPFFPSFFFFTDPFAAPYSVQLIMGWWTTHLTWLASLSFLAFITATNLFGVKYYGTPPPLDLSNQSIH